MPKKTRSKRTAPAAGLGAKGGAARSSTIRQRGSSEEKDPAVIADSLFALTLKPKTGPEMMFGAEGHEFDPEAAGRMCNDLWDAYRRLAYLQTGEKTSFNPLRSGLSIATSLHMAINGFRQLIPEKYDINIDHEGYRPNEKYHFTVYRYCEGWGRFYHTLPVGHALQVLAAKNPSLHDLFLSFIRVFSKSIGVPLWDDGMLGNTLESLDERIINMEGDSTPEELQGIRDDIHLYHEGLAAAYARKIRSTKILDPLDIKKRARRFKGPIASLIVKGADLLLHPYRLWDYDYMDQYFDGGCYLELSNQANILWQAEDNLFYEHEEYIDAIANEGIQEPVAFFIVDRNTKKFDLEELDHKVKWPGQLSEYFAVSYDIIQKFNENERINGKAPHKSPRPSAHCRVRYEC